MSISNSDTKYWDLVVESPGRINIIGEHIDYNDGFVLPTAIDKKITFYIRKNGEKEKCNFRSNDFNTEFTFYLSDIKKVKTAGKIIYLALFMKYNN